MDKLPINWCRISSTKRDKEYVSFRKYLELPSMEKTVLLSGRQSYPRSLSAVGGCFPTHLKKYMLVKVDI